MLAPHHTKDWLSKEEQKEKEKMKIEIGDIFIIDHDGFCGSVVGFYETREGKEGVVLQQIGTRVVHVYGRKWLKPNEGNINDEGVLS
jgi:hypothetical protein